MTEKKMQMIPIAKDRTNVQGSKFAISDWIIRLISIVSALFSILFFILGILIGIPQIFILGGVFLITSLIALFSHYQLQTIQLEYKILALSLLFQIGMLLVSAFFTQVWIPIAIINLTISIYFASTLLKGRYSDLSLFLGFGTAILSSIFGNYSPIAQIQSSFLLVLLIALVVILLGGYIFLLLTNRIQANLRLKLIIIFLAIALIPLVIAAFIQSQFLQTAVQSQSNTALNLAAGQVSAELDSFFTSNLDAVTRESQLSVFSNFILLPANERQNSPAETELISTVNVLRLKGFSSIPSYGILNLLGQDIFDTNPVQIGQSEVSADYFLQPSSTGTGFASQVEFSQLNGNGYIYFSAPVRDSTQKIIGILRIRYDALILQSTLDKYIGLVGQRSYPILIDENLIRLADAFRPDLLYKSVVPLSNTTRGLLSVSGRLPQLPADSSSTNLPGFATAISNFEQTPYFVSNLDPNALGNRQAGAIVKLSGQPWYLVFIEDQSIIDQVRTQQTRLSSLIATFLAGFVGVVGAIVSTTISNPILSLTNTAEKVAAGDMDAKAVIRTRDEISTLADTFNLMTNQLKGFITGLEDRVRERTQQLAQQNERLVFRSRQLQTVADVARGIAQTQELEPLLNTIVSLISNRFGFYHVGIFLVDDQNKYAVLRAANSDGGKRMLARQHKLEVGQVGIVGYVTSAGKPRIATDVGADAVYFKNPDLPQTRSEMSLPLSVGNKIIGALDVQSTESNAFSQEDTELFATLADQVAIALYNNQLYEATRQSLEESQTLHRQYLQQEWVRDAKERKTSGFTYTPQGIISAGMDNSPEVLQAIATGELVTIVPDKNANADQPISMIVPIRIRGESIGVIRLKESSTNRKGWSNEEILTIKAVADQIGLALETARLFEQTVRRADRERKVLEITSKIRSTTKSQEMLKIAMEELQRVLNATNTQVVVNPPVCCSSKENRDSFKKMSGNPQVSKKPFIIVIANEKGGVAKTTTTLSLGGGLVEMQKSVLLIDLDPQADLTIALGINPDKQPNSISPLFLNGNSIQSVSQESGIPNLFILPANMDLLQLEQDLQKLPDHQTRLQTQMDKQSMDYDFILFDCPPHLGIITLNALSIADLIIMPTQAEYFSIYALRTMMKVVKQIREEYNPEITYRLLITQFDGRNRIHNMMKEHLEKVFGFGVLQSTIELDTKLRESQIAGMPIIFHSPKSRSAMQYRALSQEILTYAQEKA